MGENAPHDTTDHQTTDLAGEDGSVNPKDREPKMGRNKGVFTILGSSTLAAIAAMVAIGIVAAMVI